MSAEPKFRKSSAVLMVRSGTQGPEVYLVQRNRKLRFFGGYWALPGGVADRLASGEREGFAACALRELFEETGLYFGSALSALPAAKRLELRTEMLAGPTPVSWSEVEPATPGALLEIGVMWTPAFAPVRYETQFYCLSIPENQEPSVIPGELEAGAFVRVEQALAEWRRGERLIVPPVRTLLECLLGRSIPQFLAFARERLGQYATGTLPPIMNSPGVCMIPLRTPTIPPATTTNHYLVGQDQMVLIDPGTPYPEEQERLFGFLDERIAAGCELTAIVLTHRHADHVGGLKALQERYDVPVMAHAHTHANLPVEVLRPVELVDGQRIDLGEAPDGSADWYLEAIWTPGHAAGHLVFQDSRYGTLIGGDLASTVSTIVIEPPEGHLATYLASLQKVIERQPTLFYPAHGPVARDGVALLKGYLKHRADREAELVAALNSMDSATVAELVPVVYAQLDVAMHSLAGMSLWAGLLKLEEEGRAVSAGERWSLVG